MIETVSVRVERVQEDVEKIGYCKAARVRRCKYENS